MVGCKYPVITRNCHSLSTSQNVKCTYTQDSWKGIQQILITAVLVLEKQEREMEKTGELQRLASIGQQA